MELLRDRVEVPTDHWFQVFFEYLNTWLLGSLPERIYPPTEQVNLAERERFQGRGDTTTFPNLLKFPSEYIYTHTYRHIQIYINMCMHVYTEQLTHNDLRTRKHNAFLKEYIADWQVTFYKIKSENILDILLPSLQFDPEIFISNKIIWFGGFSLLAGGKHKATNNKSLKQRGETQSKQCKNRYQPFQSIFRWYLQLQLVGEK